MAEFSGLLDQTIANINTLFKAAKVTEKPVILFASDCLAFLLQPVSNDSFCLTNKVYARIIYMLYIVISQGGPSAKCSILFGSCRADR